MTHYSASRPPTPSAPVTSAIPSTPPSARSVIPVSTLSISSAIRQHRIPSLPPSCSFSPVSPSPSPRAPSPSPANRPNSRISRNLYIGGWNFLPALARPSHLSNPKPLFSFHRL